MNRRHALIFNAITVGLSEVDRFMALTERDAITRRVEEVLDVEDGARCPSCDHLFARHQSDGCWHTVTNGAPSRDLVCPCATPSPTPAKET